MGEGGRHTLISLLIASYIAWNRVPDASFRNYWQTRQHSDQLRRILHSPLGGRDTNDYLMRGVNEVWVAAVGHFECLIHKTPWLRLFR